MNEKLVDFDLITKALHTSFETLKQDGENSKSLIQLKDAEINLYEALSFHLQRETGKDG